MGKPFKQELATIADTIRWAAALNLDALRRFLHREHVPCVLVGSGGSGSASHLLADLLHRRGRLCQVMTPLELYHARHQLGDRQVLLLSASGRNKDINFALRVAVAQEPRAIGCLTMSCDNPLTTQAKKYSICEIFEFSIPNRKDGFLATNTLVGTWAVLLRVAAGDDYVARDVPTAKPAALAQWGESRLSTLIVLYGDRGKPVALDIESKCTEAGLAAVQLADFRNFGHGRHHWIAKHGTSTAVVAVVTPGDEDLWAATAALLPSTVPQLVLGAATAAGSYLPLLVESFHLIDRLGELRVIDPGRPGVPEFGRQLYHLNPASFHPLPKLSRRELAVQRKAHSGGLTRPLTTTQAQELNQAAIRFGTRLATGKFGSLVVDYDGTIGAKIDKEAPLAPAVAQRLVAYLEAGFVLGVATGRGKSAAAIMRKVIPDKYWSQVAIGYYNGTVVRSLAEPLTEIDTLASPPGSLKLLLDHLMTTPALDGLVDARTHQITVHVATEAEKATLLHRLEAYLAANVVRDVSLFTSGGCIDAVSVADGSKLNVLAACQELARLRGLPAACLCIGDQGRYPGNDFLLLTTPYSLSVDEVSPNLDSCWNLAGVGQRHVAATQQYLEAITYHDGFFMVSLPL